MTKVLIRSLLKALKQTGITVGAAAALGGATAMIDPALMDAIWASTGVFAPIAVVLLSVGGQAIIDAIKHRDKMKKAPPMIERSTYRRPEYS